MKILVAGVQPMGTSMASTRVSGSAPIAMAPTSSSPRASRRRSRSPAALDDEQVDAVAGLVRGVGDPAPASRSAKEKKASWLMAMESSAVSVRLRDVYGF